MNFKIKKVNPFNLQEMLIVLAIIGILLLIALPNLMPLISKAKSVEAQTQLKAIYNAETQYFFMHSNYSPDFNQIDFMAPKTVKENGNANYEYEIIRATNNEFTARATVITDLTVMVLEPLIIVFVGILVAILLVAMYLPIFQLSSAIG